MTLFISNNAKGLCSSICPNVPILNSIQFLTKQSKSIDSRMSEVFSKAQVLVHSTNVQVSTRWICKWMCKFQLDEFARWRWRGFSRASCSISPERSRSFTKGKGSPRQSTKTQGPRVYARSLASKRTEGTDEEAANQREDWVGANQEARSTCVHPFSYVWWNKEGSSSLRSFAGSQPKRSCYRAPPYQRLPVFGQSATESSTEIHQAEPHPLDRRWSPGTGE